ncbi:hypothetical protein EB796_017872 [Bugula neritina]|uniref:Uncharacterized protein n=1 Tax=Bugula neritina TaxID=10212 RepID=A0A7J7JC34_BUGNE|nr:hypothetical protein EB796_017872 [Bugula neritina]
MGCGSSSSVATNSVSSLHGSERKSTPDVRTGKSSVGPEATVKETEVESEKTQARNPGIAFEVMLGEDKILRAPPKRLSRLEPIDGPGLTAEELEEKLRLAERKRNNELESRAKTAKESRRLSKRKRELMIARELERQHQQVKELETKLKSAERQRELHQQQKSEKQKVQEERIRRARNKKEKLLLEDEILTDVEKDENFNNDDADSWLEGTNSNYTVDTGFSSATSERIYSGQESPKKRCNPSSTMRSSFLNSASTVNSCDTISCKQSRENLREIKVLDYQASEDDKFFD